MQLEEPFSQQLHRWLSSDRPKTVSELESIFGERSFAIIILLLMALPSLPIPTGGITHLLEVICILAEIELIIGFKTFWLPKKLRHRELPKPLVRSALPLLVRRIEWVEKRSGINFGKKLLGRGWFLRLSGVLMLGGTIAAFVAPPFSGLDTLPSMGVVGMALGIIVGNMLIYFAGTFLGLLGIALEITVGAAVFAAAKKFVLHGNTTTRIIVVLLLVIVILFFFYKSKKNKH